MFVDPDLPMSAPAHSIPTWVDRDDEASSVSSESCWGEMEDFGEDNVEWGLLPCPAAPAVQKPIDVVEAFECDLLDLHGSTSHNVEVEACVTRRDTSSNVLAIGVAEEPGPPTSDCGRVTEVVEQCRRGPRRLRLQFSGSQAATVSASWRTRSLSSSHSQRQPHTL